MKNTLLLIVLLLSSYKFGFAQTTTSPCHADRENPIKFRITNTSQTGPPTFTDDYETVVPLGFDLTIDSLGLDISADELCFNLHLPDNYQQFTLNTVYEPLSIDELNIRKTAGEMNICIDRLNTEIAQQDSIYPKIPSNSSIFRCGVCIVTADADGENSVIEPIKISGYTKVALGEVINFESIPLPFGFNNEEEGNGEPQNRLEISLQLSHKNCENSGTIEIEVLNNFIMGVPPYTYTLIDVKGVLQVKSESSNSTIHQFYNLEVGEYELEVKDSNADIVGIASKRFSIDFVSGQYCSLCCAENLTIPSGIVSGIFNTSGTINFSDGTYITEGTFEVCK